jgi:hypothetical protein
MLDVSNDWADMARSGGLVRMLARIAERLVRALMSRMMSVLENGRGLALGLSGLAVGWGNGLAFGWRDDVGFQLALGFGVTPSGGLIRILRKKGSREKRETFRELFSRRLAVWPFAAWKEGRIRTVKRVHFRLFHGLKGWKATLSNSFSPGSGEPWLKQTPPVDLMGGFGNPGSHPHEKKCTRTQPEN